jgi:hypothetical protein
MKSFVLVAALSVLSSCAPRIIKQLYAPPVAALAPDAPVVVLAVDEYRPDGCELLATVIVGDAGTTVNCGLERMMSEARRQARQAGGNVLKLIQITPPNIASTCYQIAGEVFYAPDIAAMQADISRRRAADEQPRLPAGTPYALLYAYRPDNLGAGDMTYDVRLNDSVIYRARFGSRAVIRLTKPGAVTLWAEKGNKPLTLEVEPGKEYFLRCGLQVSLFKVSPWLSIVSTRLGRLEYGDK